MTLKYSHLLGREFVYGKTDCFDLLRCFYDDNFQIKVPNYARPVKFWEAGLDLYKHLAWKSGFRPIDCHPAFYLPGDLLLIAINAKIANHACVLLEGSHILHHVYGNLSTAESYSGRWRNRTLGIYRHPDVKYQVRQQSIDLLSTLPSNKQTELLNARR